MTLRVFGRTEYGEPLTEVGTAGDGVDLLAEFPGEWVELVKFAESAVHWIVRDGEVVESEHAVT